MSSRKRQDEVPQEREGGGGNADGTSGPAAVWDTGSSLYDSYELAAVRRLLDGRLLAAAGVLPLPDEPPPADGMVDRSKQQVAVVGPRRKKKVTLRALFRAVATWAAWPRRAPLDCACAGMARAQRGAAVEPDVPSRAW